MDEAALLMLLFMSWGLVTMLFGYVLGMTSKVAPLIRLIKGLDQEEVNDSAAAEKRG